MPGKGQRSLYIPLLSFMKPSGDVRQPSSKPSSLSASGECHRAQLGFKELPGLCLAPHALAESRTLAGRRASQAAPAWACGWACGQACGPQAHQ